MSDPDSEVTEEEVDSRQVERESRQYSVIRWGGLPSVISALRSLIANFGSLSAPFFFPLTFHCCPLSTF